MKRVGYIMMLVDWLAGLFAWLLFFIIRKRIESPLTWVEETWPNDQLVKGLVIIPIIWLLIWYWLDIYRGVYRKSRIEVLSTTLVGSLLGALGLLFTALSDDFTHTVSSYVHLFLMVFLVHWLCFTIVRLIFLSFTKWQLGQGQVLYKGALVSDAIDLNQIDLIHTHMIKRISPTDRDISLRMEDIDSVVIEGGDVTVLNKIIPTIIGKAKCKEIYIHDETLNILNYDYKASPKLKGSYISLKISPISGWQRNTKRLIDITVSSAMIVILTPVLLWLYFKVKGSSTGPVIYTQHRLGRHGVPFLIYKFRTMLEGAEDDGPALAVDDDDRCTPSGRWMRRWRLDELPQFFNVLKGDMSLVGPRPERAFYTDQLIEKNPRYALLWQVRPGVTSWGQIKYGYASSIDQMLKRFRYDLLYIEQMSILLDFRILYYTLIVLWQGKGK